MSSDPSRNRRALSALPDQTERYSQTTFSIVDLPARLLLIGLVTVTPWLFGGVQARIQVWLYVGVLVALVCWLIKEFTARDRRAALPVAIVPLIGAVGLGAFQLVPLGEETAALLSPVGAELRSSLLPRETSPEASLPQKLGIAAGAERQPLSLYPASTRRDLALFLLAVGVFVLGAAFFNTPGAQLWLCGLVALNGAALAFFGLVQQLTWNGLLYWTVPLTMGGGPFGPFVNRNNGAGFLSLCLAGAIAITVWSVSRNRLAYSNASVAHRQEYRPLLSRAWEQLVELVGQLDALTIASLSLTGCIVGGILCSLSRGAGIAMMGATIVTILLVLCARGRSLRLWSIGLAAAAGLALVSWVGMTSQVQARFATLLDQEMMSRTRIPNWRDGLKAAGDFWQSGSGLGTYRYVYRPYQERLSEVWYYHAENQYLEALVEGGIVGLGLMLIMIGLVGAAAWRLLRDDRDTRSFMFGIAGVFALTSQAIHGLFDFGLYIPANVLLFALLCGAVSGRAAELAGPGWWRRFLALPRAAVFPALLAASLLGAVLWGFMETRCVAAVETTLKDVRFTEPPDEVSPAVLVEAIDQVDAALKRREDDAEAQHRMATLWLHLYRARAYEQLREEMGAGSDKARLWQATSQIVLHGRAHYFARNNLSSQLKRLRDEPVIRDNLTPALKHLVLARRACPLLSEVHATMGELCAVLVDPAGDRVHIERARRLAPSNPHLLFRCGLLDLQAGRIDSASESWRKSLALSDRYLDDVLFLAGRQLSPSEMVEKVLPDSPALLIQLARERYQAEEDAEIRRLLAERAERLVEEVDLPEDQRHYLRSSASLLKGLYPKAIASLSRAVELRPEEAGWRYELAVLLEDQGRISEAHEQAKLCARMDPTNGRYRTLLKGINHTRLTTPTNLD